MRSVVPPVAGVEPELPGIAGVVPPVAGVDPEFPGDVVPVVGVVPPVAGVAPEFAGATITTGVTIMVDFTGVVATVTSVADLRTLAGVGLEDAAALMELPPPELPPLPDDAAVHCATHVNEVDGIVKLEPADCVEPELQLHPAKV